MRHHFEHTAGEIQETLQNTRPSVSRASNVDLMRDATLRSYLAAIRKTFAGLSEVEALSALTEIEQHLLLSAQAYEELGDAPDVALRNALVAFGAPSTIATRLSDTYQTTGPARTLLPWATMRRAMRVFAVANLMTMSVLLAVTCWMFAGHAFRTDPLMTFLFFVVPCLAGWRIGASGNAPRAGFGTFLALALLALVTSPLMLVMLYLPSSTLPFSDLLVVLPILFVVWLPVGCVAASVAEFRTARKARQPRLVR